MGKSEREGLGDRFRGLAWDELLLPVSTLIASLEVPYSLGDACLWGKKKNKKRERGMALATPQREHV